MPLQPTPPSLGGADSVAIGNQLQAIIDTLTSYNINLTKAERSGSFNVGDGRLPFMLDYFGSKNDYPNLKPPFMNESDADAHWKTAQVLGNLEVKAFKLLELLTDIRINSEHFAYKYGLEGYNVVGRAVEQNVPGADTFYDLLKRHFERPSQGGDGTPVPPPPLPPAGDSGTPPPPPPTA